MKMGDLRMSSHERYQLMALGVAHQILANAGKDTEKRLRMIPYGWRDLKLVTAVLDKLLTKIIKTMPQNQVRAYAHSLHDSSYTLGVKCSAVNNEKLRSDEYAVYVSLTSLYSLCGAAREKCMMCGLDKAGQAKCPLRKALDEIPNTAPDQSDGGCPYYSVI